MDADDTWWERRAGRVMGFWEFLTFLLTTKLLTPLDKGGSMGFWQFPTFRLTTELPSPVETRHHGILIISHFPFNHRVANSSRNRDMIVFWEFLTFHLTTRLPISVEMRHHGIFLIEFLTFRLTTALKNPVETEVSLDFENFSLSF